MILTHPHADHENNKEHKLIALGKLVTDTLDSTRYIVLTQDGSSIVFVMWKYVKTNEWKTK